MENKHTNSDDYTTNATIIFFIVMILLLSIYLCWQTMMISDDIQALRTTAEKYSKLFTDIENEIAAQEKQNRQAFEKLQKSIEGEW